METRLLRAIIIELVGSFGLIFFSAGLVCVNQATVPVGQPAGTAPLTVHQPGVFGVALGQGLILAALLALTVPVSGGYLNPAIGVMLWVFNRLETARAAWFIGAQILGGVLAALCLRYTFDLRLLQSAQFGAPHMNPLSYPTFTQSTIATGTVIELLLTFFLVFAIFGISGNEPLKLGLTAGMIMTVCALFGVPLTGAAVNPARWFGPTCVEAFSNASVSRSPWADMLAYVAGPILGALLGGLFVFHVYRPSDTGAGKQLPHDATGAVKAKK